MATKRGPNGRALNKDGTERKARTVLTPFEKAQRRIADRKKEMRGIGRDILKADERSSGLLGNVSRLRGWSRRANEYLVTGDGENAGTIDAQKVKDKKAYYQRCIDEVEARAAAAEAWAQNSPADLSGLEALEENVGTAVFNMVESGEEPTAEATAAICAEHMTAEVVSALQSAADPENGPFFAFQTEDEDEDESDDDNL